MNEAELLKLLEAAQKHLDAGMPMHVLNERIRTLTQGAVPGFMSLQLAIEPSIRRGSENVAVRDNAIENANDENLRTSAINDASALQHFAESVVQGGSLGFADDIASMFGKEGFGERLAARRELNPKASLAAEAVGLLVPGAATAKAMRAATKGAGLLASTGRGAGIAAGEGAVIGFGEAEGSAGERLAGAGIGAAVSAPFGAIGPAIGRAARPFRSNRMQAGIEGRNIIDQTGKTAEEVFEEMRQLQRNPGLGGTAAAIDVDPSIGGRAPGIVRQAPGLRNAGGPLPTLQARVGPGMKDQMRKNVWGAFDGQRIDDAAIMKWLRTNPQAREAANVVVPGDIGAKKHLLFEQVQDVLEGMRLRANKLNRGGVSSQADRTLQSRRHLETLLERSVPGYKEANSVWADALTRFEGAEKLINSIDRALPSFSPELPSRVDGVVSTVRETLSNSKTRKEMIARMVGEAILTDGDEGIEMLQNLVKRGTIAELFRGTFHGTPGGAALGVPGLLTAPDRQ